MEVMANNFTSGEVSAKLGGRIDLGLYQNGVSRLENFIPMLQGGITRRPGTRLVAALDGPCRIMPFVISVDLAFIVELSAGKLRIRDHLGSPVALLVEGVSADHFAVPYLQSEVWEIQYTQDYRTLFLAHRNHPPKMLTYTGGSFTFGTLVPATDPKYSGMFQGAGNYPGCVAYCANRIWFASSTNNPYRLWASRPFEQDDFTTYDTVVTVDKVVKDPPWPEGWDDDPSLIYEEKTTARDVVGADNAMVLEVGSNRNDRIEWIAVGRNLVVGTASGEWLMPGNIDALNPQIVQASAYGSAPLQAMTVNEDILFVQSGKRRCRGYVSSADGYSSPDLTYAADHILEAGVREWAFQRVPEPRVYCVLEDGTVAVLSYNKLYGLQAWAKSTFSGPVKSLCVLDCPSGQDVYAVIVRGTGTCLEKFDESSVVHADHLGEDEEIPFDSEMVGNRMDFQFTGGTTIGKRKRVTRVTLRLLASGSFSAGYRGLENHSGQIAEGDVSVSIGGGFDPELRMQVKSSGSDPLTVLAMVFQTEVV